MPTERTGSCGTLSLGSVPGIICEAEQVCSGGTGRPLLWISHALTPTGTGLDAFIAAEAVPASRVSRRVWDLGQDGLAVKYEL